MTDRFKATMDSDYFTNSPKYWKVTIEANSLKELNNICSAINLIRKGGLECDKR